MVEDDNCEIFIITVGKNGFNWFSMKPIKLSFKKASLIFMVSDVWY